jgi:hypothetical protein
MRTVWMLLATVLALPAVSQENSGEAMIRKMHSKYYQGPCKCYTFSQKNYHYRNDSVIRNSYWHERVEFPDRFTIIFGDSAKGDAVYFRNDSVLRFRGAKQLRAEPDSNILLLLLGGMYYRPLDDVFSRLKESRFDVTKSHEQVWNGRTVVVVGAHKDDLSLNQFWVDKATLRIVRILEQLRPSGQMDMRFEAHRDWCKGYVETKVSFRRNGVLEQVEEYYNLLPCSK